MNGIYGRAATGLKDAGWAVSEGAARAGAKGERKTEELLNGFALKAAVLHDLRVPIPVLTPNIDHVVVSGKSVLLIDSKLWKPGFYWSLLGPRRGWERAPHAGKSQEYITRAVTSYLKGTGAQVIPPRLVVWSSREDQPVSTWALRVPGAVVVNGTGIVPLVRSFVRQGPADPLIVSRLRQLLIRPSMSAPAAGTRRYSPTEHDDTDPFA